MLVSGRRGRHLLDAERHSTVEVGHPKLRSCCPGELFRRGLFSQPACQPPLQHHVCKSWQDTFSRPSFDHICSRIPLSLMPAMYLLMFKTLCKRTPGNSTLVVLKLRGLVIHSYSQGVPLKFYFTLNQSEEFKLLCLHALKCVCVCACLKEKKSVHTCSTLSKISPPDWA